MRMTSQIGSTRVVTGWGLLTATVLMAAANANADHASKDVLLNHMTLAIFGQIPERGQSWFAEKGVQHVKDGGILGTVSSKITPRYKSRCVLEFREDVEIVDAENVTSFASKLTTIDFRKVRKFGASMMAEHMEERRPTFKGRLEKRIGAPDPSFTPKVTANAVIEGENVVCMTDTTGRKLGCYSAVIRPTADITETVNMLAAYAEIRKRCPPVQ